MGAYKYRYAIRQGNVFHVPTMPLRLAFAVVVRRAFVEFECDEEGPLDERKDAIAVAWPPAIAKKVQETAAHWNRSENAPVPVALKIQMAGSNLVVPEMFTLTPCDGLMEAVRIALERGFTLAFVDRNPTLSDLSDVSPCSPKPTLWADDWFAVESGIDRYRALTRETVERHPWRNEPVASMRARCMAASLQELSAEFRRVLFVSFLKDHRFVSHLLQEPLLTRDQDNEPTEHFTAQQQGDRLSLQMLVQALDDFPRVTDRYELMRRQNRQDFDKLGIVLQEVESFAREFEVSFRRLDALKRMLPGICIEDGRLTPRMAHLLEAAEACFPASAVASLRNFLFVYSNLITIERSREIGPELGKG